MHIFIHKYIYICAFHQSITSFIICLQLILITSCYYKSKLFFFFSLSFLLLFNTEKYGNVVRSSFQSLLEVYGDTLDEACKPCQLSCFQQRYHFPSYNHQLCFPFWPWWEPSLSSRAKCTMAVHFFQSVRLRRNPQIGCYGTAGLFELYCE